MPNEIELKLRIAARDVPKLKQHPAIKKHLVGEPLSRKLISIYYDTPALELLDAGLSLRVRSMCGGWFQAIKSAGHSVAGLHQRLEWEDLLTKNEPDFNKIIDPHLANIFSDPRLRAELKPIFIVDVMRTDWQLHYEDGTEIELSLDMGELHIDQLHEPIEEIELELKQGNTNHLFELALALQADIPLTIENISKAQRGYAYLRPPPIIKTQTQTINKYVSSLTKIELFQHCIGELQTNQEVLLKINHTAAVYHMRTAKNMLIDLLNQSSADSTTLINELNWLAPFLITPCDQDNYEKLKFTLQSQRYQRLFLHLGAWLHQQTH